MRREGFELSIGPPKAVMIPDPERNPTGKSHGAWLEPIEECTVFVKEEYAGGVVQKLTMRKGEMKSYDAGEPDEGWVKIVMDVPARGLIGYMAGEFANDVHGQGLIYCFPLNIPPLKKLIIEPSTISSKGTSHSRAQSTQAETARSSQWPRASRQGMPWHPFRLEEPSLSTRKLKVTKLSTFLKIFILFTRPSIPWHGYRRIIKIDRTVFEPDGEETVDEHSCCGCR
jgi:hypothetical protein